MICENIQFLRKKRNLTQESLAEKIGVSRQTIAKWENGESMPDLEMAERLSQTLDVPLDELVHMTVEQGPVKLDPMKGKHMFGLVTVGDKGQIVIPVQARRVFHINPGDQLVVLGDEDRGLALMNAEFFLTAAEVMRNGEG
jgi:AbrB family looped-hinge helix DNA binding protein